VEIDCIEEIITVIMEIVIKTVIEETVIRIIIMERLIRTVTVEMLIRIVIVEKLISIFTLLPLIKSKLKPIRLVTVIILKLEIKPIIKQETFTKVKLIVKVTLEQVT